MDYSLIKFEYLKVKDYRLVRSKVDVYVMFF